jgi:hypothetical protein
MFQPAQSQSIAIRIFLSIKLSFSALLIVSMLIVQMQEVAEEQVGLSKGVLSVMELLVEEQDSENASIEQSSFGEGSSSLDGQCHFHKLCEPVPPDLILAKPRRYVPPHRRDANVVKALTAQEHEAFADDFDGTCLLVAASSVCSDDDARSTHCSSTSSSGARVHFSDTVQFVEPVHNAASVDCQDVTSCWETLARDRQSRFGLRVHCARLCDGRGCTREYAGGLCSRGGNLLPETRAGIDDVFAAWRRLANIPATVPFHMLNHGRTWRPARCRR